LNWFLTPIYGGGLSEAEDVTVLLKDIPTWPEYFEKNLARHQEEGEVL
jgi:hypothetical protein